MNRPPKAVLNNERGVALAFVALLLFVLLGLAALAIDIGMLYGARTEAQRTADAAALAGAGSLLATLNPDAARASAIEYGARNSVRRETVIILPGDVDVILDSQKVRVHVRLTEDRGSAMTTVFARAIGIRTVDVATVAAAQAFPAGGINTECAFPFALPDRWRKGDGTWPGLSDNFDPAAGDVYVPVDQAGATGYQAPRDIGFPIQIRGQQPNRADYQPGFWRQVWFWEGSGSAGQPQIWSAIRGCTGREFRSAFIGEQLSQIAPGFGAAGQQRAAFDDVVASDPNLRWSDSCNGGPGCLHRGDFVPVTSSPRIRPIALFDPTVPVANGAGQLRISNFVYVFVESSAFGGGGGPGNPGQPSVWVRFVGGAGLPLDNFNPNFGPVIRVLRLVE